MIDQLLTFDSSGSCIDSPVWWLDVLAVFLRSQIDHAAVELVLLLLTNATPLY